MSSSTETHLEFCRRQVDKWREIVDEDSGATSVGVNGTNTAHADAAEKLRYWMGQLALAKKAARRFERMKVGGFQ